MQLNQMCLIKKNIINCISIRAMLSDEELAWQLDNNSSSVLVLLDFVLFCGARSLFSRLMSF